MAPTAMYQPYGADVAEPPSSLGGAVQGGSDHYGGVAYLKAGATVDFVACLFAANEANVSLPRTRAR